MINYNLINELYNNLSKQNKEWVDMSIEKMVQAKERGGNIVVVTGSGPNIHEGVTTLIAELIHKGIIDGVTTSSAVVAHEMAGALEKVHRVDGRKLGIPQEKLPIDNLVEASILPEEDALMIKEEFPYDEDYIAKILAQDGNTIIKAAGNLAYPLGLRTERIAREAEALAKANGLPLEAVVGHGADRMTMLGAAAANNKELLVTVPQLVGGAAVGLAIGDSISITERSMRIAKMMGKADIIIESAVALTQEIHDGPFEMYTGHGIWPDHEGYYTYSLADKTIIRIDLDPNLELAWKKQRESNIVQEAIAKGLPKTKLTGVPFRMEMSGFSRLPGSIPIIDDIGKVWPIIALKVSERLGISLDFISYPQATEEGQKMREWIVKNVRPVNRKKMYEAFRK
ncbi:MAG TPA: hypothetical protein GXZ20_03090 [Halanaerobiaceae bacterium]|nr:hypothetical protein [Halanaerobiaceae bacterium]